MRRRTYRPRSVSDRYEVMVEFAVLGPVVVRQQGRALALGSGRQCFVLAILLLNEGRLVPTDRLIDALWPEPPATAKAQLHNMISGLRRRLRGVADGLIVSRPLGYELYLGEHRLDLKE